MAELLVRVVDKVNPDFYANTKCLKRGDVIAVCEDGWGWGVEELANPDWRILKIPDMTVAEASVFLAPERNRDPGQPSRTLQRRAFAIDLDHPAIDQAGLRAFADVHEVIPIAARDTHDLEQIAVTEVVVSHHERMVQPALGSLPPIFKKTPSVREVVTYPVAHLHPFIADKVAGLGVTHVGARIRTHCHATASAELLTTVKRAKPPIADPSIIGPPKGVIG